MSLPGRSTSVSGWGQPDAQDSESAPGRIWLELEHPPAWRCAEDQASELALEDVALGEVVVLPVDEMSRLADQDELAVQDVGF